MTVKANSKGQVKGSFVVPKDIPTGSKRVEFFGSGGSQGEARYIGRGTEIVETRQRIRDITVTRFIQRSDPLAQTFTLDESRHISGCDFWFKKRGKTPVRLQIRETEVGIPTQDVLAEGQILPSQVNLNDKSTRINVDPVWLEAGREYAIVLLTDDAIHSVCYAELGKFDQKSGWVTSQPYQVGVLLSSSNASTWTPHQKRDLAFRLQGCRFTKTTKDIVVGKVKAKDITDIIALADVERTGSETDIEWIARSGKHVIRLQENQPLNLPTPINGTYEIIARLKGSAKRSPVLYPGAQAILGRLKKQAEYVSRAVDCKNRNSKITVHFEVLTPGNSSIDMRQQIKGKWVKSKLEEVDPVGDNWLERTYVLNAKTPDTRVKIMLSGHAGARPLARNLRMVVTDA